MVVWYYFSTVFSF